MRYYIMIMFRMVAEMANTPEWRTDQNIKYEANVKNPTKPTKTRHLHLECAIFLYIQFCRDESTGD